jgi:hypothetical protein
VLNFGAYVRRDAYNYYPSGNPLADLGPANLQTSSIAQYRTLTNAGLRTDFSYEKGMNNIKVGAVYQQTFLRENDSLGVVDPTYNSPYKLVPKGRLNLAQDASPGLDLSYDPVPQGRLKIDREPILDNLQPSLRDSIMLHDVPRTSVLG